MASKRTNTLAYHLMLLPGVLLVLVFSYVPIYGVVIATIEQTQARWKHQPQP